jgi:hypothetical protein
MQGSAWCDEEDAIDNPKRLIDGNGNGAGECGPSQSTGLISLYGSDIFCTGLISFMCVFFVGQIFGWVGVHPCPLHNKSEWNVRSASQTIGPSIALVFLLGIGCANRTSMAHHDLNVGRRTLRSRLGRLVR